MIAYKLVDFEYRSPEGWLYKPGTYVEASPPVPGEADCRFIKRYPHGALHFFVDYDRALDLLREHYKLSEELPGWRQMYYRILEVCTGPATADPDSQHIVTAHHCRVLRDITPAELLRNVDRAHAQR